MGQGEKGRDEQQAHVHKWLTASFPASSLASSPAQGYWRGDMIAVTRCITLEALYSQH